MKEIAEHISCISLYLFSCRWRSLQQIVTERNLKIKLIVVQQFELVVEVVVHQHIKGMVKLVTIRIKIKEIVHEHWKLNNFQNR
ncbi:unnamed protein product [Schistosoma curassoni]|nr:unnamed protein product [Schistosoma curassoni]